MDEFLKKKFNIFHGKMFSSIFKNDVEKRRKQFVYNFNILNDYGDEWNNLQSQV